MVSVFGTGGQALVNDSVWGQSISWTGADEARGPIDGKSQPSTPFQMQGDRTQEKVSI